MDLHHRPDAGDTRDYAWNPTSGPSVTLSDPTAVTADLHGADRAATLTLDLTAGDRPAATGITFVNRPDDGNVQPPGAEGIDAAGEGVVVNGPVSSRKTSKSFVLKVTNEGTGPLTLDLGAALSGSVTVNGTPTGDVTGPTGTDTSTRVIASGTSSLGRIPRDPSQRATQSCSTRA